MQRYIDQLTGDLLQFSKNPPEPFYIETPPQLEDLPDLAELALVPFITIEELTGIKQEEFPEMIDLSADQCRQIANAIFKVFESLHIELVDKPDDLPDEILYDALVWGWNSYVQYLPSTVMDFELCTGDPDDCPYGSYCDCGEEFDEYELPEKYAKVIEPIAASLDIGLLCFLNPDTMEIEDLDEMMLSDPDEFESITGLKAEEMEIKHRHWKESIQFNPWESKEAFDVMVSFANSVEDENFKDELFLVLNNKKPFANFNALILNTAYMFEWAEFRLSRLKDHVRHTIYKYLHNITGNEEEEEGDWLF